MYYLFKVERCDAINLLSKHETFEDALAAMKESLVKKNQRNQRLFYHGRRPHAGKRG